MIVGLPAIILLPNANKPQPNSNPKAQRHKVFFFVAFFLVLITFSFSA